MLKVCNAIRLRLTVRPLFLLYNSSYIHTPVFPIVLKFKYKNIKLFLYFVQFRKKKKKYCQWYCMLKRDRKGGGVKMIEKKKNEEFELKLKFEMDAEYH